MHLSFCVLVQIHFIKAYEQIEIDVLHVCTKLFANCFQVYICSGQSNMAFSVTVPTNDESAEAKIAAAYSTDPGASMHGKYVTTDEAIKNSVNYQNVRFMVVGNKHSCAAPIADYNPSPVNTSLTLAHPWQKPSPTTIGGGKDVMGGNGAGEMSATCYYFGIELWETQQVQLLLCFLVIFVKRNVDLTV